MVEKKVKVKTVGEVKVLEPDDITIYIQPFRLNYPVRDAIAKLMWERGYEETGSGCLLAEDKYDIGFKKREDGH